MNISRNTFTKVLEILEKDGCIDSFEFYKIANAIEVHSSKNDAIYNFDNNNNLINPQVFEIQKEIEELERQKNDLEQKMKKLLTNS